MLFKILLDDCWQVECFDNETEAVYGKKPAETIPAKVPGDVHLDLLGAGIISDPYYSLNAEKCQWVSERYWVYKKTFCIDKKHFSGKCNLVFKGLDTYATVFLNGIELGKTANMFIEHRFDVSDLLQVGENEITVRFVPPLEPVSGKDTSNYPSAFDSLRLFNRKMQSSSGWDWAPRILNIGIWRSVELEFYDHGRIKDIFVRTISIDKKYAIINIDVENEFLNFDYNSKIKLLVEIFDADGISVAKKTSRQKIPMPFH